MDEPIELALESADGIIDCRVEPVEDEAGLYSATILYPNVINGFSRSEIYCHNLLLDKKTGNYFFETNDNTLLPKIRKLEAQISAAIKSAWRRPPPPKGKML
jgi:hypothetical protein